VRVLYQIWDRPIYTIGGRHVISDALRTCGARNIFSDLETAAPAVTREAALTRNPELILVSAPPDSAGEWIAEWRKFPSVSAVRNGNLVPYADERMDRMGPSVIDATARLCEVIDRARLPPGAGRRQPGSDIRNCHGRPAPGPRKYLYPVASERYLPPPGTQGSFLAGKCLW
jgi:hypothetical protein